MRAPTATEQAKDACITSIEQSIGMHITVFIRILRQGVPHASLLARLLTPLLRKDSPMAWSKDLLVVLDELVARTKNNHSLTTEMLRRAVARPDRDNTRVLTHDDVRWANYNLRDEEIAAVRAERNPDLDKLYGDFLLLAHEIAPHIKLPDQYPQGPEHRKGDPDFAIFRELLSDIQMVALVKRLSRELDAEHDDAQAGDGGTVAEGKGSSNVKGDRETEHGHVRPAAASAEPMAKKSLKRKATNEDDCDSPERRNEKPVRERVIKRLRKLDPKTSKIGQVVGA